MTYTLASKSLQELLERARTLIQEQGSMHETQRGRTYSLNNVMLTWEKPAEDATSYWYWDEEADEWYQKYFVERADVNDPAVLPAAGDPLYSYRYAHRSRFWDGGWGYVVAVLRALAKEGVQELPESPAELKTVIARAAQHVHVQAVMAALLWVGRSHMHALLADPGRAEEMLGRMRMDTLQNAVEEIKANPGSRRAVTVSFVYPAIDFALKPAMSVPPYQFFQLLPADKPDAELASSHVHRSLDVAGGAQLDFHHDLAWLSEAAAATGRPVGDITVIAHNLHLYVAGAESNGHLTEKTTIQEWLNAVVDGYPAGSPEARALLEKDVYTENIARLLKAWHH